VLPSLLVTLNVQALNTLDYLPSILGFKIAYSSANIGSTFSHGFLSAQLKDRTETYRKRQ
jgi:hypothetical protein